MWGRMSTSESLEQPERRESKSDRQPEALVVGCIVLSSDSRSRCLLRYVRGVDLPDSVPARRTSLPLRWLSKQARIHSGSAPL